MVIEAIHNRRSIRKYKDQPVEEEKLLEIINCGRLAPSDTNTQPWNFIVVRSEEMRTKLAEVSHRQDWMVAAPVFIVCVADIRVRVATTETLRMCINEDTPGIALKQVILDTAIAGENIVLAAEALGLGTCWVSWFVQDEIRPVLDIPSDKYVVAIITMGYADQTPKPRPRRSLDEVIRYERW
jgi:nitroreductase